MTFYMARVVMAWKGNEHTRMTKLVAINNGYREIAKRDAGIPKGQQPKAVNRVDMRTAAHEGGHVIKDSSGNVISTREYVYTNKDGRKIVIQDHSAGHVKGGQGPHFNVRPSGNTRTGKVPGRKEHYPFNK
ncbi:HNH/endonuclease VII fold putative polymorphic toxin [Bacillus massilinigeriensis]|uniref:HNH/endonuclease VII fold putative polymorphic toxin n=1 Tax=Bacillus mediterraneensis TaxID=1805474 RepID=UPI0009F63169|nr:HNH/endonuclease VII fold putative polymorphic toxin [Bacillus mediterraneensis]